MSQIINLNDGSNPPPFTVVQTIEGNTGGPVGPDGSNNINLVNANTTVDIAGNPGTFTLTQDFGISNLILGSDAVGIAGAVENVGFGQFALVNLTSGSANIAVGYNSGIGITTGSRNISIGRSSNGSSPATGTDNIAIGYGAIALIGGTTNTYNISIGSLAGSVNTGSNASSNILLNAINMNNASNQLIIGNGTGTGAQQLISAKICGIDGVNVGSVAKIVTMASDQLGTATITAGTGISVTPGANTITIASTGISSISITGDTGGALTGAAFTFTGGGASKAGVTVQFEGSVSTQTLNVTDANGNTILGGGNAINSGNANAGIGQSVLGNCTGDNNMAMGAAALFALTSGDDNIGIGYQALYAGAGIGITTGNRNIGIGSNAGSAYTSSETDNILIGYQVTGTVAENHVLRIGNGTGSGTGNLSSAFICGIDNVNVGSVAKVVTMASDQLGTATITAGTGITVTPGANTITISATTTGMPWTVVTGASQALAVNNGYIANNAGTIAFSLPASSVVGDTIRITGINNATGWQITQGAGQQIFFGTASTTLGAGGTLTSSATRDSIEIVCVVANTIWNVLSSIGNPTVV